MTINFHGVYTAIITPFQNEGRSVDYGAYRELIERQVAAGVSGIVPCGTTGESPTLSHAEHRELVRKTVELAAGRTKVIAGTGSNSTAEAVALTQEACSDGADAVMLVNPYYNKPSQEGLYRHFKTVAEASKVPVVLYTIKGRTAVNLEVETLVRLVEVPNIAAVKEASGDPGQMARVQRFCGDRLVMLSGDDNITPALMGLGGRGVISVASNIYPKRLVRMVNHFLAEEFSAGNAIFYELLDFMNAMFWDSNPGPVKAAAAIRGFAQATVRLPLVQFEGPRLAELKQLMEKLGED